VSKAANKQQQIAAVIGITTSIVIVLYFFAITPLHSSLESAEQDIAGAQSTLDKYRFNVRKSTEIEENAKEINEKLALAEETIPHGDLYLWMLNNFQSYKERPNLEFNQIDPPRPAEPNSIPVLPYPTVAYTISGTGFYSDFGVFLADFENSFPYARVRSLEIEPTSPGRPGEEEREKLRFRFEFVTPAKTATPK
jgi:Tfp pilus assembly protein PilO